MQKQAPSARTRHGHGRLRAVVLRAAAVPVARVRRRRSRSSRRATASHVASRRPAQLAQEADVRISGVPVGKVKTIDADKQTGRVRRRRSSSTTRYAPLPSDAKAILRQKTLLGETYVELTPGTATAPTIPEGGRLPAGAGRRRRSSSTRSSARSTRPTRDAFQVWMQTSSRSRSRAAGATSTTRSATSRRSPRTRATLLRHPQPPAGRGAARCRQHRRRLRRADRARRPAARADRELQHGVRDDRGARPASSQATFRALPTFERESTLTLNRLDGSSPTTRTRWSRSCGRRRASCRPTLQDLATLAPDLKALLRATSTR